MNNNLKLLKNLTLIFYTTFFLIILLCIIETFTYPGIFHNKFKINLSSLITWLSIVILPVYIKLQSLKSFKLAKNIYKFSLFTILFTICLSILEILTYPNFVFSKLYINYKALQILSYFLFTFLILQLIPKLHFKLKKINFKSKLFIVIFLLLTPIISYISWSQHLSINHIMVSETKFLSFSKNLIDSNNGTKKQALQNQLIWFFKPIDNYGNIKIFFNFFNISFSTIFVLIAIMFFINWWQSKYRLRTGILLTLFYLGAIIYTILIILICVTMFSPGELKVFQGRYILTFILALYTFSFYIFLKSLKEQKMSRFNIIYILIILFTTNFFNLYKLKPIKKEIYINRKEKEKSLQWIKDNLDKNNNKIIIHTIEGDGPVGYRYVLAPYQVITPIWQDWDTFMFTNSEFTHVTNVFVPSANEIIQKWSPQIEKIFKDKNLVINNGLYQVVYSNKDTSFELKLINKNE